MSGCRATKRVRLRDDWKKLRPRVTKRLLAEITDRIVNAFHPHKVILFGSYAYGRPHIYSDVDLLVIMPSHDSMHERMMRVGEVADVPFGPMDVLVYTPAEVRRRRTTTSSRRSSPGERSSTNVASVDAWVDKAEDDWKGAVALSRRRKDPLSDLVCFHRQQCAEKYLKAVLVKARKQPPKIHGLVKLVDLCARLDHLLAALTPLARSLDMYAVHVRHPEVQATVAESKDALATTRTVRRVLRKALGR